MSKSLEESIIKNLLLSCLLLFLFLVSFRRTYIIKLFSLEKKTFKYIKMKKRKYQSYHSYSSIGDEKEIYNDAEDDLN